MSLNLIIITRLRSNPEFDFQQRTHFECPQGILKVYEGSNLWVQCQEFGKQGNVLTNYETLFTKIKQLIADSGFDQYVLIHDQRTVTKLEENKQDVVFHLAPYSSLWGETQEYFWVSEAVKTAGQGKDVGELVAQIIHHYFLRPAFTEAKENLEKCFACGAEETPDFDTEICPSRHPSFPQFATAVQQLRAIYQRHLPEYRKTPKDVQYAQLEQLQAEVHTLSF